MNARPAAVRLTDPEFHALREYLRATAGLVFDQSRRASLTAVVVERLRATGAGGVSAYLGLVQSPAGAPERQRLLDGVTVQETHFFRNGPQTEALRRQVLPELLRRAAGRGRPLTVWSAGCSSGEEPYTLAMLLLDLAPTIGFGGARILGTDVSAAALQTARRATYVGRTLELAPAAVRETWFVPGESGALVVAEPVRRLVDLRLHNLVTEPAPFGPGEVDLVVCRNVTIYFDRATTRALIGAFHGVLAEGGYLLLGHSETLWQLSDDFTLVPVGEAFVYRRAPRGPGRGPTRRRRLPPLRRAAGRADPAAEPPRAPGSAPVPGYPPATAPGHVPAPVRSGPSVAQPGAVAGAVPRSAAASGPAAVAASPAGLLTEARSALAAGAYAAAARAARAAVAADALLAPAYVVLGRAYTALGEDAAAVELLRKAVYLEPAAGEAHFLLAGALARLGHHSGAAAAYRAAAGTLPALAPDAQQELFGGRNVAELVGLCERLADRSAQLGTGSARSASASASGLARGGATLAGGAS